MDGEINQKLDRDELSPFSYLHCHFGQALYDHLTGKSKEYFYGHKRQLGEVKYGYVFKWNDELKLFEKLDDGPHYYLGKIGVMDRRRERTVSE